jgi:hypothetical protein
VTAAPAARSRRAAFVLSLILAGAITAHAQDTAARGARAARGPVVRPAELATMLDAYTIVQAQTALELTDAQFGQFVTRLKRLQENRRRNTIVRNRLLQELRALMAPGPAAENAIKEKLQALREHTEQSAAALRRDSDAVDEVLDLRQQVRFRLLEERLERMKLDLLMRARDRGGRPADGRKPGGGG